MDLLKNFDKVSVVDAYFYRVLNNLSGHRCFKGIPSIGYGKYCVLIVHSAVRHVAFFE